MKLPGTLIIALLFLGATQSFADKILMLAPPTKGLECHEIYDTAAPPRSTTDVLTAMLPVCERKGGLHVLNGLYGGATHPQGVILSCVGDTPDRVMFACYFPKN